jgi:GNAT superfamily N-acetyltransferase
MEINIRLAKPEELEQLITLQTLAISNPHSNYRKYNRQQIDVLIRGQADARRKYTLLETILVAEDCSDNSLVGFAAIGDYTPRIHGVYIHPDLMNQGIGTKLVTAIEKLSIEKNVKVLLVQSSIESVDFYKRNGYAVKVNSGFLSGWVWIPCKLLKKELLPLTFSEKLGISLAIIASSKIALIVLVVVVIARIIWKYIPK